jgi:tetratricopeptide (TPR) repeat protein
VILLKNDCEKGAGVDLAKTYEVRVYPTFAMVNEQGEVTDRWAGYPGPEEFMALVDAAKQDMSTIAEKKERFQSEPTLALARSLAQYSEAVFANVEAVDYYRKIMVLDPASTTATRGKIFMSMFYGLRQQAFTVDQLLAEGEAILASEDASEDDVLMVASVARRVAPTEDYLPFLDQALAITEHAESEEMQAFRQELLVDQALLVEKDKDKALGLRKATMPDGWQDDPAALNQFAWWCFENDVNLDEAFQLAMKGADLAGDDGTRANILDTAAEIAFKLGKVDKAIELETEAVKLAPDRDGFKQTLEKFQGAAQG